MVTTLFPAVTRWCPCLLVVWFRGDLLIRFCFDLVFQPSTKLRFDYWCCSFFLCKVSLSRSLAILKCKSRFPHTHNFASSGDSCVVGLFPLPTVHGHHSFTCWLITFNLEQKVELKGSCCCLCTCKNPNKPFSKIDLGSFPCLPSWVNFQWKMGVFRMLKWCS